MYIDDVMFITFLITSVPFVIWGMWGFSCWIMSLIKVRRGYIEVEWIEKNHQKRSKLVKPEKSNKIKIGELEYPLILDPAYYVLKGAKKIITFTRLGEKMKQIDYSAASRSKGEPPEDIFNDMLIEAEQVGRILGFKPDVLIKLVTFVAAGAAVIAVIGLIILNGQVNLMPAQIGDVVSEQNVNLAQQVAQAVREAIASTPTTISNATIIS